MSDPKKIKLINYDYAKYGASAERRRLIAKWEKSRTRASEAESGFSMGFSANRPLWAWLLVGALGYLALPWYAAQDSNGLLLIGQGFGDEHVGNGLMQALAYGRPWLLLGVLGLALSAVGAAMAPGRAQGAWVLAGAWWAWPACWSAALPLARGAGPLTA
jgi:hypothetical protein